MVGGCFAKCVVVTVGVDACRMGKNEVDENSEQALELGLWRTCVNCNDKIFPYVRMLAGRGLRIAWHMLCEFAAEQCRKAKTERRVSCCLVFVRRGPRRGRAFTRHVM